MSAPFAWAAANPELLSADYSSTVIHQLDRKSSQFIQTDLESL